LRSRDLLLAQSFRIAMMTPNGGRLDITAQAAGITQFKLTNMQTSRTLQGCLCTVTRGDKSEAQKMVISSWMRIK